MNHLGGARDESDEISRSNATEFLGVGKSWCHLSSLREPENLRGWLCGILRQKIRRLRRSAGRESDRLAEGPMAFAQHANDLVARQLLADPHAELSERVIAIVVSLLSLGPVIFYARVVRRRAGGRR